MHQKDWVDIWREMHSDQKQYTWVRRHPIIMSHLDYFLIHESTIDMIVNCKIIPCYLSDHSAVILELQMDKEIRGGGIGSLIIVI